MGLLSKPIKTLDDLFVHTLQDIYYAENQIVLRRESDCEVAAEDDR
jgi:ferritin-like metal-binding protein YciE